MDQYPYGESKTWKGGSAWAILQERLVAGVSESCIRRYRSKYHLITRDKRGRIGLTNRFGVQKRTTWYESDVYLGQREELQKEKKRNAK